MAEQDKHWIGVDLDATLAAYRGWKGPKHIGRPLPKMVRRIKRWLNDGKQVKIFTARVSGDDGTARRAIKKFCLEVFGQELPITNRKDQYCVSIWDDKAHNMKANTGDQMHKAAFLAGYMRKTQAGDLDKVAFFTGYLDKSAEDMPQPQPKPQQQQTLYAASPAMLMMQGDPEARLRADTERAEKLNAAARKKQVPVGTAASTSSRVTLRSTVK